jgi:thioredoxin 1
MNRINSSKILIIALLALSVSLEYSMDVYKNTNDPQLNINKALEQAINNGKDVLLIFGADWCPDCQNMENIITNKIDTFINTDFIVVHIDIGKFNKNIDLMKSFGLNPKKGIPALVIIDPQKNNKIVYANGEFENARNMDGTVVQNLLNDSLQFLSNNEAQNIQIIFGEITVNH